MTPELLHLIDQNSWCRASVEAVAAALPPGDAELDAAIAETVRDCHSLGFMFLTYAALSRNRPVDSRHLIGGARLIIGAGYLPPLVHRVHGDMPECLLEGLRDTVMHQETEAIALISIAMWCDEHRGGNYPDGLLPAARMLARRGKDIPAVTIYLLSIALRTNDDALLRLLRKKHAYLSAEAWEKTVDDNRRMVEQKTPLSLAPILDILPEAPTYAMDPSTTVRRSVARIGRNDPCHCGSGKKYKNCCAESDRQRLQNSSGVTGHTLQEVNEAPERHLTLERLDKMSAMGLARMNPLEIPRHLLTDYFVRLAFFSLDRAAEFHEKLGYADDLEDAWLWTMWTAARAGRKDIGERLMKLREPSGFSEDQLRLGQRLLLAQDDPGKCVLLLEEAARAALDSEDTGPLIDLAYSASHSKFSALGILLYRGVLPLAKLKIAQQYYEELVTIRERLKLPPDDPIHEILDANAAKAGEEADRALRDAEEKFEAKRREVRALRESLEQAQKELTRREKSTTAAAAAAAAGHDDELVRDLRQKVKYLQSSISEKNDERNFLQRQMEALETKVETLEERGQLAAPASAEETKPDHEDELLLHEDAEGNQPLRIIEFPRNFNDRLADVPRHVARAAMTMLGRLAAGEPSAFTGVKRLKSRPSVLRQRIGIDFRLLFRLLPDRIQVIDLIPRQDFERKIKTLT